MDKIKYSAEELNSLILYADNHLLAVNKPAGLLSQDSGTGLKNLEDWAREWVRVDKNKQGAVFLNAVHRIDKGVSGIVLFARTSKALTRLNEDIRKRDCKKIYHALVEQPPRKATDKLEHWLSHGNQRADLRREGESGAKRAVLSYRIMKEVGDLTLLEIDLETGRYHQIRAQLSAVSCPIAGDQKYGAKKKDGSGEIALHHRQLEIIHPTKKESLKIEAPYPEQSPWWSLI